MMNTVNRVTRILAPIAMLCGATASAADSGLYVGLSLGEASYDVEEGVSGEFDVTTTSRLFDTDSTLGINAGYRFNPFIAVELAYLDLGELRYSETGRDVAPVSSGALDTTVSARGFGFAVVGSFPVGGWDFHAKLGGLQTKTEYEEVIRSQTALQQEFDSSASTFEMTYGVGVGYTIAERFNFSIDYTKIPDVGDEDKTGEADVDVLSFGASYRF
jgi:OOP family OmpA-OmpF porin